MSVTSDLRHRSRDESNACRRGQRLAWVSAAHDSEVVFQVK